MDRLQIQRGDVELHEIEPDRCEDCDVRLATHWIALDVRPWGMTVGVGGVYCEGCGLALVDDIRAGLAPDTEDGLAPAEEEKADGRGS